MEPSVLRICQVKLYGPLWRIWTWVVSHHLLHVEALLLSVRPRPVVQTPDGHRQVRCFAQAMARAGSLRSLPSDTAGGAPRGPRRAAVRAAVVARRTGQGGRARCWSGFDAPNWKVWARDRERISCRGGGWLLEVDFWRSQRDHFDG